MDGVARSNSARLDTFRWSVSVLPWEQKQMARYLASRPEGSIAVGQRTWGHGSQAGKPAFGIFRR